MMLCIAVKEAFHTLQEELKKENVVKTKVGCYFWAKRMEGFDKFFFHIRFGGIRSCDWILLEWENACSSMVPTAIIGDPNRI